MDARTAYRSRANDHALPDPRAVHPLPNCHDLASRILAWDQRQMFRSTSFPANDIQVPRPVNGDRMHAHQNFAGERHGIPDLFDPQLLRPAIASRNHRSHSLFAFLDAHWPDPVQYARPISKLWKSRCKCAVVPCHIVRRPPIALMTVATAM